MSTAEEMIKQEFGYDAMGCFYSNDTTWAIKNGKVFHIDLDGKPLYEERFIDVGEFENLPITWAISEVGHDRKIINRKGEFINMTNEFYENVYKYPYNYYIDSESLDAMLQRLLDICNSTLLDNLKITNNVNFNNVELTLSSGILLSKCYYNSEYNSDETSDAFFKDLAHGLASLMETLDSEKRNTITQILLSSKSYSENKNSLSESHINEDTSESSVLLGAGMAIELKDEVPKYEMTKKRIKVISEIAQSPIDDADILNKIVTASHLPTKRMSILCLIYIYCKKEIFDIYYDLFSYMDKVTFNLIYDYCRYMVDRESNIPANALKLISKAIDTGHSEDIKNIIRLIEVKVPYPTIYNIYGIKSDVSEGGDNNGRE